MAVYKIKVYLIANDILGSMKHSRPCVCLQTLMCNYVMLGATAAPFRPLEELTHSLKIAEQKYGKNLGLFNKVFSLSDRLRKKLENRGLM